MSNFVKNGGEICLDWSWYLQVDFQLFICGLLLVWLYSKSKWLFMLANALLCIGSTVFNFLYVQINHIKLMVDVEESDTGQYL